MDLTKAQPAPVRNDGPCVQDLVIEDLKTFTPTQQFGGVADVAVAFVSADIEARKTQGLQKYGTLLQPNNGRDAVVDAYQEVIDGVQYLRQAKEEGLPYVDIAYRAAVELALHIRTCLLDLESWKASRVGTGGVGQV